MIDWHCVLDRETHELVTEPFASLEDLQAWMLDANVLENTDRWIVVHLVSVPDSAVRIGNATPRFDGWLWAR